jgi:transcriptional regulator with XRE-family HTH domain
MLNKKNIEAKKFAQCLRRIMRDSGYRVSPTILAHAFNLRYKGEGITVSAASNWLNGISIPKMDKLMTLANLFQVQIQDLLFDKFPVQNISFASLNSNDVMHFDNVSPTELKALHIYRQLPKEHRKMVREVVLGFKSLNSVGDE